MLEDGTVDVKGLTGKKKHIPIFIKDAFNQMKETVAKVKNPEDFEKARKDIAAIVSERYNVLKRREWGEISELAFHMVLGDELQVIQKQRRSTSKLPKFLQTSGKEIRAGDQISFVKVIKSSSSRGNSSEVLILTLVLNLLS